MLHIIKYPFTQLFTVLTIALLIAVIVANQQLINYAKLHNVPSQMNTAGSSGSVSTICRSIHLPWLAKHFDFLTPTAFIALVILTGMLIWRKQNKLSRTVTTWVIGVIIVGFSTMIYYQFVDPFYPFSLCRGLLT